MQIKIKLSAQARSLSGRAEDTFDCPPNTTAPQALALYIDARAEILRALLLDSSNTPRPSTMLFINNEQVSPFDTTPLKDGDVLTILPPIAGG